MNQFGQIFISDQFDSAAVALTQKWVDTYLSEMERRSAIPVRSIDRPKSYNVVIEPDKFPEDALPSVFVVSTGIATEPERLGEGHYSGWWNWALVALVSLRDEESTRRVAQIYGAALRSLAVNKAALEGLGTTVWATESYDFVPVTSRNRTMGVAALEFRTFIDGLVEEPEGPLLPDPPIPVGDPNQPYPDWPEVHTTDVQVDNKTLNQSVND